MLQVTSILYHTSGRFGRWLAHFFVRVATGDEGSASKQSDAGFWWSRHPDTFRIFMIVGGIILVSGLVLTLIGFIACGFDVHNLPAMPQVNIADSDIFGFLHIN